MSRMAGFLTRCLEVFCFVSFFGMFVLFCWELSVVPIESLLPVAVTFLKEAQTLICNLQEQPPKR